MKFAKKSLGQNFLKDKNIIKKIISLVDINDKNVIEIGPGKGSLTNEILKYKLKSLTLIEKDEDLVKQLKSKYNNNNKIIIFCEDILKFDLERIVKKDTVIFGNLPYNISSQILVKIINFKNWPPKFNNLIFMFQKELGEKILGKFKTKNYGRISILTNLRLSFKEKFFVSPNCFFPKPKVMSVVINFTPKSKIDFKINNIKTLERVTNIFFSNKRKMINKNIKKILKNNEIKKISNINESLRASDIEPKIYYKIAEIIEMRKKDSFYN